MNEVIVKKHHHQVGILLRIFREKTGRRLSDVASGAGISISMLSQIERGVVSPSIETLFDVCSSLGLEVSELFSKFSQRDSVKIYRSGHRLLSEKKGVSYEQLISSYNTTYPAEMFLLEIEPDSKTGLSGRGHEGIEMGYILDGKAILTVDSQDYPIVEQDSVTFSSHLPHRIVNAGETVFKAIWTVLPPHKDYLEIAQKDIL